MVINDITELEGKTIGCKELAKILDISARHVRQLADEGIIKKVGRNQYRLAESVQGYISYIAQSRLLKI